LIVDPKGRPLCCPYDDDGMASYYGLPASVGAGTPGRRAAMRKRLSGTLEEIAQRAAATRGGR
jgi:hypothetical protein